MKLSIKKLLLIAGLALVVFLGWGVWQLVGPDPPIVVSKETTYITAPLRPDGQPDYERYVLEKSREGVTPENNAAVLFWQAMGPGEMDPDEFAAVAKEIGLDPIPSKTNTLENYYSKENRQAVANWLREQGRLPIQPELEKANSEGWPFTSEEDEMVDAVIDLAMSQPWTSKEIPPLDEWIVRNQAPFDLMVAAMKRPRFYAPPPEMLDDQPDSLLIMVANDTIQSTRNAVRMLLLRAMWHLGENQPEQGWQDLLAIHRLARLIGTQNATLVDSLVAFAVDGIGVAGTMVFLGNPSLSADLARQAQRDLNELGPPSAIATSFNELERLFALDFLLLLREGNLEALEGFGDNKRANRLAAAFSIDWNILLMEQNRWHDEVVAALKIPDKEARRKSAEKLEAEAKRPITPGRFAMGAFDRQVRSHVLNDFIISQNNFSVVSLACGAEDRAVTQLALAQIAAAVAVYHAEHGEYPENLEALTHGIVKDLPNDGFHDQPFVYSRTNNGYLLYSRGENGKDEGGSHKLWQRYHGYSSEPELIEQVKILLGDEMPEVKLEIQEQLQGLSESDRLLHSPLNDHIPPDADDISIRLPLPKLQLPKRAK